MAKDKTKTYGLYPIQAIVVMANLWTIKWTMQHKCGSVFVLQTTIMQGPRSDRCARARHLGRPNPSTIWSSVIKTLKKR